jgi:hypothetical protein
MGQNVYSCAELTGAKNLDMLSEALRMIHKRFRGTYNNGKMG